MTLLLSHPGHGYAPICEPPDPILAMCLVPQAQEVHGGSILLARTLLARGGTRFAALQVAPEAATSPEAAEVLALALSALGDDYGASLVRAALVEGRIPVLTGPPSTPPEPPAATKASAPRASPGTR